MSILRCIRLKILILAILLIAGIPAFCQKIELKHYGRSEGLSNQVVSCLLQDHEGFLWIGTQNGLFRYDGQRFERFGITENLPSPYVYALHEDRMGHLWVQTEYGFGRFENRRFSLVGPHVSLGWVGSAGVDSTAQGLVYFATPLGLGVAKPLSFSHFQVTIQPLPRGDQGPVHAVHVDREGGIWFSTETTLYHSTNGNLEIIGATLGVPKDRWDAIHIDREQNIWLRSGTKLLVRERDHQNFRVEKQDLSHSGDIESFLMTSQGDLLTPNGRGLSLRHHNRWSYLGEHEGVPAVSTSVLLEDREGSIWWGTWGAGLHQWKGFSTWQGWTRAQGLSSELVWQIRRDAKGALWAATDDGLNVLEPGRHQWRSVALTGRVDGNDVRTFCFKDGWIWTGSAPGGLRRIDASGVITRIAAESPLRDANIFRMEVDRENRIWVASDKGLFRSAPEASSFRFEQQISASPASSHGFYAVFVDGKGRVWAGDDNSGLLCFDHGTWRIITQRDGLLSKQIRTIAGDGSGNIWVGYAGDVGLSRITLLPNNELRFKHFFKKDGLNSTAVIFIGCDRRGWIWSGTDDGVDVFNGVKWRHIGTQDGLLWDDCDTNGFLADDDGTVWVGTSRGIGQMYGPPRTQPLTPPSVAITALVEPGSIHLNPHGLLRLPYHEALNIAYAGLSFTDEASVKFRYRLRGLSDDWSQTEARSLEYSSLEPGFYTFEVFAKNGEGTLSKSSAAISFQVLTPWWLCFWTKLAAVLCIVLLAYLGFTWRMKKIRKHNAALQTSLEERTHLLKRANEVSRLKSEFLANMSHELRTPIHGIMGLASLTLDSELEGEERENVEIINTSAQSLLGILNDILDFSKIEANCLELEQINFKIPELLHSCLQPLTVLAQSKGLKLNSNLQNSDWPEVIGDPVRIRQVITNLVNNALKFTERGSVTVTVSQRPLNDNELSLQVAVQDTGIGIPLEKQSTIFDAFVQADGSMTRRFGGTGLGLSICSKLIRMMNGRIWVESEMGKGSTFHFEAALRIASPVTADSELQSLVTVLD